MLGTLMALWSVAIMPIIIKISAAVGADFLPAGYITIRTIGLAIRFDWKVITGNQGIDLELRYSDRKKSVSHSVREIKRFDPQFAQLMLKDPLLRKNALSYLEALRFRAQLRIGFQDAAATALACGALSAAFGCIPNMQSQVIPDFRTNEFCVQAKCIASFRLGKLLASAAIYLRAIMMQHLRQKAGGAENGKSAASDRQRHADGA